jgi:hypothetical protein
MEREKPPAETIGGAGDGIVGKTRQRSGNRSIPSILEVETREIDIIRTETIESGNGRACDDAKNWSAEGLSNRISVLENDGVASNGFRAKSMKTINRKLKSINSSRVPFESFRPKLGREVRRVSGVEQGRSTEMLRDSWGDVATELEFCLGGRWGATGYNKGNESFRRVTEAKPCLIRHL